MLVFHGCPDTEIGHTIMKEGVLRGRATQERGHLAPLPNRVYFTTDTRMAAIYALGGVFLGTDRPVQPKNPTGYVFKAEANLDQCIPDEDCVGWIVCEIKNVREGKPVSPYCDNPVLAQALRDNPGMAESLAHAIGSHMTERQKRMAEDGLLAHMAQGGKRALPYMSAHQKRWMVDHGAHFSHEGEVRWQEAWSLPKSLSIQLKENGSNLFEVATLTATQATLSEARVRRVGDLANIAQGLVDARTAGLGAR
jgi:hypothetical protein